LVVLAVDVVLGAEGPLVQHVLGALVDDGALLPGALALVGISLAEVLAALRADRFQAVAEMRRDRIVAPQGLLALEQVDDADHAQATEDRQAPAGHRRPGKGGAEGHRQQQAGDERPVARGQHGLSCLVPGVGVEPTWPRGRGILSPLRLPVSPPGRGLRHVAAMRPAATTAPSGRRQGLRKRAARRGEVMPEAPAERKEAGVRKKEGPRMSGALRKLEAGVGIEPAYADLQSAA